MRPLYWGLHSVGGLRPGSAALKRRAGVSPRSGGREAPPCYCSNNLTHLVERRQRRREAPGCFFRQPRCNDRASAYILRRYLAAV